MVSISLSSGFSFQANGASAAMATDIDVSISLSSGFSFQGKEYTVLHPGLFRFQSRYRAASHFRQVRLGGAGNRQQGFNLVIERLLISGWMRNWGRYTRTCFVSISLSSGFSFQGTAVSPRVDSLFKFQSRYRAASHFRSPYRGRQCPLSSRFNLVIERLLISGTSRSVASERRLLCHHVSISLSSGFSFQGLIDILYRHRALHLFQSRYRAASHFRCIQA